ncbi:MAG: DMT family transporter [Acidimicrobiia bacterium]|nr:DMT family transporter [Acidimicrobiia bacterium]
MRRLLLLAGIWGWSFLFIKVAVAGLPPVVVAAARIMLGATVLLMVCRAKGLHLPRDRATWKHLAIAAVFGNILPFTLLAWGEERVTSALTSVLNASTPLFTAMVGAAVLGERLRRPQLAGLGIGLLGVAVAAGVGGQDLAESSVSGSLAAVAAGACYGVAFTYLKRHLMGLPAEVGAAGQLLAGSVLLGPLAVVLGAVEGVSLSPTRVLAVVLLGVLGTGAAYVLYYRAVADLGPTRASLVTYLVPLVAVAVGVIVLDEPFHLRVLAGGILIVAGIALTSAFRRAPTAVAVAPGR